MPAKPYLKKGEISIRFKSIHTDSGATSNPIRKLGIIKEPYNHVAGFLA
jgi:hypothetical protein